MPNELAPTAPTQVARIDWSDEALLKTVQETVCRGSNPAQFRMFVEVCKATGLNPFLKEVWFVPQVGIMAARDGYLRVANEHPMFDGMSTLVERDAKGIPIKATCTVWRKDRNHPIICEAYYNEYVKPSSVWNQYKSAMISKVAEVLALKRSFSINGVVTEEEIGPQGSAAARDEVRDRKLADIAAKSPVTEFTPSPDTMIELADSLPEAATEQESPNPAAAPKRKRGQVSFDVLKYFGELKTKFKADTGSDKGYYAALAAHGYKHADEIKDNDEARRIYKQAIDDIKTAAINADIRRTLEQAREQLGGERFWAILGQDFACSTLDEALAYEPIGDLLAALKTAWDSIRSGEGQPVHFPNGKFDEEVGF